MEKNLTYSEAKIKMENWCAYQERCSFEIRTKLYLFGISEEHTEKMLAELIETRFVDDVRFAEAYTQGKFNIKRWGKIKIRQHLKQKRIDNSLILKALDIIDPEKYLECIDHLILKKAKDFKSNLSFYQKKAKIHQYLGSKGFEFDLIESQMEGKI